MDVAGFLLEEEFRPRERRPSGRAGGRVLLAPAPFDDARVQGAVDFVFGRPVLKSDLELAFSAEVGGHFYRAKIGRPYKGVEGSVDRGEHAITIGGSILRDNLQVGTFRRSFTRKKTGAIVARHDLLKLDDDLPLGIGSAMLRNTLAFEMASHVEAVHLSAAWVGRYVWASLGWTWADAETRDDKLAEFRRFLRLGRNAALIPGGPVGEVCFSTDAQPKACATYSSKEEGVVGIAETLSRAQAFEFASLRFYAPSPPRGEILGECPVQTDEGRRRRVADCHAGKVFLLSATTSEWEGVLRLRAGDPGFEHCKRRLRL